MKKGIFYIPAILFAILFGVLALNNGIIHPVIIVWLVLFFLSGVVLQKNIFWGAIFGMAPAFHMIYMGTQDTGQIINEASIGVAIIIFYIICGLFVFRNNKTAS